MHQTWESSHSSEHIVIMHEASCVQADLLPSPCMQVLDIPQTPESSRTICEITPELAQPCRQKTYHCGISKCDHAPVFEDGTPCASCCKNHSDAAQTSTTPKDFLGAYLGAHCQKSANRRVDDAGALQHFLQCRLVDLSCCRMNSNKRYISCCTHNLM